MLVPETPGALGLPYPKWRHYQREVIEEILQAPERAVLIDAPPGMGKSMVAAALALMTRGKSLILCSTIQLQDQYLRDFSFMQRVVGKGQYNCILPGMESLPVSAAPCRTGWRCPKVSQCPYFVQQRQSLGAHVLVTSYAKALSSYLGRWSLMVCDEGHLLEGQILNSNTIRLPYKDFTAAGFPVPPFGTIDEAANWATGKHAQVVREMDNLRPALDVDDHSANIHQRQRYLTLQSVRYSLAQLQSADSKTLWTIEPYRNVMCIRPIWAYAHAHKLFGQPEKLIVQSATIPDGDRLAKILGIKKFRYITVPNQFPTSRRPIYYWPVAPVGFKSTDEDQQAIVDAVDKLLDRYPQRRGIVHTVNMTLTKLIAQRSRHARRLIVQPPGKKRGWGIDKFLQTPYAVLVSPSVMHGLDGRFEKARFQILVKLPFEDQSQEATAERLEADRQWYAYQCAFHIQQMAGRVMRDEMDYGVTWILDAHGDWFFEQNWHLFSDWFQEAFEERRDGI